MILGHKGHVFGICSHVDLKAKKFYGAFVDIMRLNKILKLFDMPGIN